MIEPIELPCQIGGGLARHARTVAVNIGLCQHKRPVVLIAIAEPDDRSKSALFVDMSPKRARAISASLLRHAEEIESGQVGTGTPRDEEPELMRLIEWSAQHSDLTPIDGSDSTSPSVGDLRYVLRSVGLL